MTIDPNTKSVLMVPLVRMELLTIGRRRMSAEELPPAKATSIPGCQEARGRTEPRFLVMMTGVGTALLV
jgi:hypothetical protein